MAPIQSTKTSRIQSTTAQHEHSFTLATRRPGSIRTGWCAPPAMLSSVGWFGRLKRALGGKTPDEDGREEAGATDEPAEIELTPAQRRFADVAIDVALERDDVVDADVDAADFCLLLELEDGTERECPLSEAFSRASRSDATDRAERSVKALLNRVVGQRDGALVDGDWLLAVKPRSQFALREADEPDVLREPLVGTLDVVAGRVDRGAVVYPNATGEISVATAIAKARAKLRAPAKRVTLEVWPGPGSGLWRVDADEPWVSGLLGLPVWVRSVMERSPGRPVFAAPSADSVLVADERHADALLELIEVAYREFEVARDPVSPALYVAEGAGTLSELVLHADDAVGVALRNAAAAARVAEYNAQARFLRDREESPWVPEVMHLRNDDGEPLTHVLVQLGMDAWLPEVTLYTFLTSPSAEEFLQFVASRGVPVATETTETAEQLRGMMDADDVLGPDTTAYLLAQDFWEAAGERAERVAGLDPPRLSVSRETIRELAQWAARADQP